MKKFTVAISDDAYRQLLKIQLDRKISGHSITSLAEIAGEVLSKHLEESAEKEKEPK